MPTETPNTAARDNGRGESIIAGFVGVAAALALVVVLVLSIIEGASR